MSVKLLYLLPTVGPAWEIDSHVASGGRRDAATKVGLKSTLPIVSSSEPNILFPATSAGAWVVVKYTHLVTKLSHSVILI